MNMHTSIVSVLVLMKLASDPLRSPNILQLIGNGVFSLSSSVKSEFRESHKFKVPSKDFPNEMLRLLRVSKFGFV